MPRDNVIDIKAHLSIRSLRERTAPYRLRLEQLDKVELLAELLHYHDLHQMAPEDPTLTVRAEVLMEVLEQRAYLNELKELARDFQKKLHDRLTTQVTKS